MAHVFQFFASPASAGEAKRWISCVKKRAVRHRLESSMIDPCDCSQQLPLIAPSILAADFANLGDDCRAAMDAGADLLHVDIMDGHFVPNLSMGPAVCGAVRKACPDTFLDVHLMVTDPQAYFRPFIDNGANLVSFHIETCESAQHAIDLAGEIRELGCRPGIVINPPTDVRVLMGTLEAFDLILVMSVNPGFGGQAFIGEVLEKAAWISPQLQEHQRLEIDGGIGLATAPSAINAGFDTLVAGSAIFGKPQKEWASIIAQMRESRVQ